MEQLYVPPDNPVFQLVPPPFEEHIQTAYAALGTPPISHRTFWDVYIHLLNHFQNLAHNPAPILSPYQTSTNIHDPIELLPGLKELPNGNGAINDDDHGEGSSRHRECGEFTDDESGSDWDN
jgi:hypothetical protein